MTTRANYWIFWMAIGLINDAFRILRGLNKVILDSGTSNVSPHHLFVRIVLQRLFIADLCYVRSTVTTHLLKKYHVA